MNKFLSIYKLNCQSIILSNYKTSTRLYQPIIQNLHEKTLYYLHITFKDNLNLYIQQKCQTPNMKQYYSQCFKVIIVPKR